MVDVYGTYILDAILIVGVGLILYVKYAAPYITNMADVKNFDFISAWVDKAVTAAEQKIKGSELGEERKEWVINLLESLGIIVDDAVDALIEAAVKAMNDANKTIQDAANEAIDNVDPNIIANKISSDIISTLKSAVEDVTVAITKNP